MTQVGKVDILDDEIERTNTAIDPLNPVEAGAAIVIARKTCHGRDGESIVLAFLGLDHVTPYVTWLEYESPVTGRTVYSNGHYFYADQEHAAFADYQHRLH